MLPATALTSSQTTAGCKSPRKSKFFAVADWNQDAALLIALGEECAVLNLNDGSALGTPRNAACPLPSVQAPVRAQALQQWHGRHDQLLHRRRAANRSDAGRKSKPLGYCYSGLLKKWSGTHTAPFSCHHMFARTDSRWASNYETPDRGAPQSCFKPHARGRSFPATFRTMSQQDRITETAMEPAPREFREPRRVRRRLVGAARSTGRADGARVLPEIRSSAAEIPVHRRAGRRSGQFRGPRRPEGSGHQLSRRHATLS